MYLYLYGIDKPVTILLGHFMAVLRKEGEPETAVKAGNRDQLYLDGRKRKEVFRDYEPFIPVSYTHLDVYKRQQQESPLYLSSL